jgi:hypothetical protein
MCDTETGKCCGMEMMLTTKLMEITDCDRSETTGKFGILQVFG